MACWPGGDELFVGDTEDTVGAHAGSLPRRSGPR
jgi:hypothetical protein